MIGKSADAGAINAANVNDDCLLSCGRKFLTGTANKITPVPIYGWHSYRFRCGLWGNVKSGRHIGRAVLEALMIVNGALLLHI